MSDLETLKPCDSCGVNVPSARGQENGDGKFLCLACCPVSQTVLPAMNHEDSQRRCNFCDQVIARKDCHRNRYGEYVCLECSKKGKRWSSRRRFLKVAKRLLRFALIALIGVSAASGYVWLMIKIMNRISQTPPPPND
jgi:hypothetical protein